MIDELESDRQAEISDSIKRQDRKEDAARDKKLNELFEKQLRSNQTKFNELPAIGAKEPNQGKTERDVAFYLAKWLRLKR